MPSRSSRKNISLYTTSKAQKRQRKKLIETRIWSMVKQINKKTKISQITFAEDEPRVTHERFLDC